MILSRRRGFTGHRTGDGCDGFHVKVPLDLTEETRNRSGEILGESGTKWEVMASL